MKKLIIILLSCVFSAFANQVTDQAEDYESGRAKIAKIIASQKLDKNIQGEETTDFAEVLNVHDLNINEIARFFDCKTLIGHSFLIETLNMPYSKVGNDSQLIKRQRIIRTLVENHELKNEVDNFINLAHEHEQEVIKLFSDFFKGQSCPEIKNLEVIKEQNPAFYPVMEFFISNPTARTMASAFNVLGLVGCTYSSAYIGYLAYQLAKIGYDYAELAVYSGYLGVVAGISTYGLYKDYTDGYRKREKMHSLNQLISVAEKIEDLCIQYDMRTQFKMSKIENADGKHLINKLKHSRYQNKKTYLFMFPLVHSFLYKVYQQEQQFAELFSCVAEIDAYNAIATKIIESQSKKNKLCFATFVESDQPLINGQAFWNVLVSEAVPSSIVENRHVVLTGPNAGGKTTAIRAILQNIIFAQSFGIAAADSWHMTLFDVIHSYMNVSDDLINGLSLFASEVKRAQEILQRIKTLNGKKFFFALDELFTGTVAEDGETCAYEFVKRISQFSNTQFIYATHFGKLKELGADNDVCANYKVDAPTKNEHGKLVYPFTLSQGASDSRVALDIARQANLFE